MSYLLQAVQPIYIQGLIVLNIQAGEASYIGSCPDLMFASKLEEVKLWLQYLCKTLFMFLALANRLVSKLGAAGLWIKSAAKIDLIVQYSYCAWVVTFVQSQIWSTLCPLRSSTASLATNCAFIANITSWDIEILAFCDNISWSFNNKLISCASDWIAVEAEQLLRMNGNLCVQRQIKFLLRLGICCLHLLVFQMADPMDRQRFQEQLSMQQSHKIKLEKRGPKW
ncbi:MAG: hypothetical protein EZS28_014428 [Streblomastix strix]|uniref:Uncharacterized protein n=1 Tax=Streblomastix strix TaxID=222440 RepID=A0A5J4W5R4_9EUKA|nr:MAG: hypothetical protein EZS28_014428 [Streblomastix strix]